METKKKKTYKSIFILVFILILAGIYRYFYINKDINKKYVIDKYNMEQVIKLDNLDLTVSSFKKVKNAKNTEQNNLKNAVDFTLEMVVKNTSADIVNVSSIIQSSIGAGVFSTQGEYEDKDNKKIKKVSPGESYTIILNYSIPEVMFERFSNEQGFELYIDRELYKDEIINRVKVRKFENYGKAIRLSINS